MAKNYTRQQLIEMSVEELRSLLSETNYTRKQLEKMSVEELRSINESIVIPQPEIKDKINPNIKGIPSRKETPPTLKYTTRKDWEQAIGDESTREECTAECWTPTDCCVACDGMNENEPQPCFTYSCERFYHCTGPTPQSCTQEEAMSDEPWWDDPCYTSGNGHCVVNDEFKGYCSEIVYQDPSGPGQGAKCREDWQATCGNPNYNGACQGGRHHAECCDYDWQCAEPASLIFDSCEQRFQNKWGYDIDDDYPVMGTYGELPHGYQLEETCWSQFGYWWDGNRPSEAMWWCNLINQGIGGGFWCIFTSDDDKKFHCNWSDWDGTNDNDWFSHRNLMNEINNWSSIEHYIDKLEDCVLGAPRKCIGNEMGGGCKVCVGGINNGYECTSNDDCGEDDEYLCKDYAAEENLGTFACTCNGNTGGNQDYGLSADWYEGRWWHPNDYIRYGQYKTCNICVRNPDGGVEMDETKDYDGVWGKCFNGNPPVSFDLPDEKSTIRTLQDHARIPTYGYCCDSNAYNFSGNLACGIGNSGIIGETGAPFGNWLPMYGKSDEENIPAFYESSDGEIWQRYHVDFGKGTGTQTCPTFEDMELLQNSRPNNIPNEIKQYGMNHHDPLGW